MLVIGKAGTREIITFQYISFRRPHRGPLGDHRQAGEPLRPLHVLAGRHEEHRLRPRPQAHPRPLLLGIRVRDELGQERQGPAEDGGQGGEEEEQEEEEAVILSCDFVTCLSEYDKTRFKKYMTENFKKFF